MTITDISGTYNPSTSTDGVNEYTGTFHDLMNTGISSDLGAGNAFKITVNNLAVGVKYRIQFLIDQTTVDREFTLASGGKSLSIDTNGNGTSAVAVFTADAATQEFTFTAGNRGFVNAVAVFNLTKGRKRVTPEADTYVQSDNSGPYGSNASVGVKKVDPEGTKTRKGIVRFNLGSRKASLVLGAALTFNTTAWNSGVHQGIKCFGVADGHSDENFNEATYKKTDMDGYDTSGDGISNADPMWANSGQPYFEMTIGPNTVSHEMTVTSKSLLEFIQADSNQLITFVFTRQNAGVSVNLAFAANEHATIDPITLEILYPAGSVFYFR